MTLWAIVPVKPLQRGKSRLSSVLSPDERQVLNQQLLVHTLETLKTIPELEHVLVVSRDSRALSLARQFGARTVQEHGTPRLNVALTRATIFVRRFSTRGVLIVPADLPLLTRDDVYKLLEYAHDPPVVVLSPDRHCDGTNAMLVSPPGLIDYHYGPNSFQRHCQLAKQANARLEVVELPSLALDVDIPEDLELAGLQVSGSDVVWTLKSSSQAEDIRSC